MYMHMDTNVPRSSDVFHFVSPEVQVNAGLWCLFAGASVFLGLRLWCKTRRQGLWWDDYILIASWLALMGTDILISYEFATGYVTKTWGDRMLILVSISSSGTTVGQTLSKTALSVTLLKITNAWQRTSLWAIIFTLNVLMVAKIFVDWAKYCNTPGYQNYWRMQGFCVDYTTAQNLKQAGNIFNIVADFLLALFPWMVTWKLNIKKYEKVALCATMSLGIVVAIYSAVRTGYMADPSMSKYDDWYFWRQGLSMVWYSAEVAGTIIVQSVPMMRGLVKDMRTSLTSRKLHTSSGLPSKGVDGAQVHSTTKRRTLTVLDNSEGNNDNNNNSKSKSPGSFKAWRSKNSSKNSSKNTSETDNSYNVNSFGGGDDDAEHFALGDLRNLRNADEMTASQVEMGIKQSHTAPLGAGDDDTRAQGRPPPDLNQQSHYEHDPDWPIRSTQDTIYGSNTATYTATVTSSGSRRGARR